MRDSPKMQRSENKRKNDGRGGIRLLRTKGGLFHRCEGLAPGDAGSTVLGSWQARCLPNKATECVLWISSTPVVDVNQLVFWGPKALGSRQCVKKDLPGAILLTQNQTKKKK
jgi:hypothetical protein